MVHVKVKGKKGGYKKPGRPSKVDKKKARKAHGSSHK